MIRLYARLNNKQGRTSAARKKQRLALVERIKYSNDLILMTNVKLEAMNKEIKTIIEATSMGKLEKNAVIQSLLDLHIVSISDDEIMKIAVDKASNNNYTWNFDYGVDMAKWMRDKLINH